MQNALLISRGGLQTWPRKAHLPDFCFVARSWACAVLFLGFPPPDSDFYSIRLHRVYFVCNFCVLCWLMSEPQNQYNKPNLNVLKC